jgi:hypothetical protein
MKKTIYGKCPKCHLRAKGVMTRGMGKRNRTAWFCKPCMKKQNDSRAQYRREWHRKKKYGVTGEEVIDMMRKQKNMCPICRKKLATKLHKGRFNSHVDHSHKTGKVRGILCFHCNTGLGHFGDSTKNLKAAIKYLLKD